MVVGLAVLGRRHRRVARRAAARDARGALPAGALRRLPDGWRQRRRPKAVALRGGATALRASFSAAGSDSSDPLGKDIAGKAIIVGWDPGPGERKPDEPPWSPEDSLDELEALCDSLNIEVQGRVFQRWRPDRNTAFPIGKGKIAELRQMVQDDPEVGVVVFDNELSYRALLSLKGRIAPEGECVILDRTSLIMRIFASRARTKEARLQVELASQQYMLPRLRYYLTEGAGLEARGGSTAGSSMSGSAGGALKGLGDTQLHDDKFMMVREMAEIKKKLQAVRKHRELVRHKTAELGLPVLALVGYTNAGKSSLLNRLCGSVEATAKDRAFETLDPTRRRVKLEGGREAFVVDTVGFLQRLPTELVAGFRATLEELTEATIVLHVVDVSSPTAAQQVGTVMRTLKEIKGFDPKTPQILVFNKVDKLEGGVPEELEQSLSFPWPGVVGHCQISALNGTGIAGLAQAIEETILEHTTFGAEKLRLLIPYTKSADYAKVRGPPPMARIEREEHTNDGYLIDVVASTDAARQLRKYEVPGESSSNKKVAMDDLDALNPSSDDEIADLAELEELEELERLLAMSEDDVNGAADGDTRLPSAARQGAPRVDQLVPASDD